MAKITQEIRSSIKEVDLFYPFYLDFLRNCYYNKSVKPSKEKIPLVFNNIKVRVYVYRCQNLAAQDNSNDFLQLMSGYSAFCKANAFLELSLGDNPQR